MADLQQGSTVGGSAIWAQSNLDLKIVNNTLHFKTFKLYSENDKPTPAEVGAVNKTGDIMSGALTIRGASVDALINLHARPTSETAYQTYYNSTGTIRWGYQGFGSSGNTSWQFSNERGGSFDFLTSAAAKGALKVKGFPVYHEGYKPTWSDIGGNSYFFPDGDKIISARRWMRSYGADGGVLPALENTGNDAVSYVGNSTWWFKESWVNTYRGGSINITGISQSKGVLSTSDVILQATPDKPSDTPDIVFLNANGDEVGRLWKGSGADEMNVRFGPSAPTYTVYHTGNKPSPYDIGAPAAYYNVPDGTDLFEYLKTAKPGFHRMGKTIGNKPTGSSSWMDMIVVEHGTGYRTALIMDGDTRAWQITITPTGVVGGGWKKIYSETQKPSAEDVGAVSTESQVLNTTTDWDTLDTTAFYDVFKDTNTVFTNAPEFASYGTLQVIGRGKKTRSFVTQIFTQRTSNIQWFRTRTDGEFGWSLWVKIYSEANKPTWGDVGGNSYFTYDGGHLKASTWVKAAGSTTGFLPALAQTGDNAVSTIGTSGYWFKESWVNKYRGGSVDVTGVVRGGSLNVGDFDATTNAIRIRSSVDTSWGDRNAPAAFGYKHQNNSSAHWLLASHNPDGVIRAGLQVLNSTAGSVRLYDGQGYMNLTNGQIVMSNSSQSTDPNSATRRSYVDTLSSTKVNKAGDTMTGSLTVNAHVRIYTPDGVTGNHILENASSVSTYRVDNTGGWRLYMGETAKIAMHVNQNGNVNVQSGELYEKSQRVYSPNFKPTAGDVGALPISGGTMTGKISTSSTYALVREGTSDNQSLFMDATRTIIGGAGSGTEGILLRPLGTKQGSLEVQINPSGHILELGQRVYSPNNKPTAGDVGALSEGIKLLNTSTDWDTLNTTASYSVYASSGVIFDNAPPNTDFGTLSVIGGGATYFVTQVFTRRTYNTQWIRTRTDLGGGAAWSPWSRIYSEDFKPTWADVGGGSYWSLGTYITAQSGKWIQAANNATGFIPYSTGNSSLGTSAFVFKESWVNTYRGGAIDITGGASIGQTLNFKQVYNGLHWKAVAETGGNLSFGLYDAADVFNKNALSLSSSGNVNALNQLYENGQRVYSPHNKPSAGDVGLGNVANYGPTNSYNGTSTSLYATQKAVYDAASAPLLESDRKRKITSGTAAPSGGADGDIYLQYK